MQMKTIDARAAYAEMLVPRRRSIAMHMRRSRPCPLATWCEGGTSTSPAWTVSHRAGSQPGRAGCRRGGLEAVAWSWFADDRSSNTVED